MKKRAIPKPVLERIDSELLAGEDLLWAGQPGVGRIMMQASPKTAAPLLALISLLIMGVAVSAIFVNMALLGVFLAALILTAIAGTPIAQYFAAKQTIYAVTNRRAFVLSGDDVQSYGKSELQSLQRKMKGKQRGDIIFNQDAKTRMSPSSFGLMLHRVEHIDKGFFGIENPAQVEALLLETFVTGTHDYDTTRLETHDSQDDDRLVYAEQESGLQSNTM